ncbi:MAG: ABC transporter ATP-binding protein [Planctomycetota bacterium]
MDLTKSYGPRRGVVELNLEVREGEVFGFLGPNGAGKTTTIRTLLDLVRPTAGRAEIFGRDCHRDGLAIRRDVGYLPGELSLYDNQTGAHFLRYIAGLRGGRGMPRARELSERLGADLTRPVRALSHGNRQKLGLVQAFMGDPRLLILDEPSTGLDPLMQRELHRWIAEARERGATVFLSSHALAEVERVCDRVGIVRGGRLVAVEAVAELPSRSVRRVEATFRGPAPAEALERVDGVSGLRVEGDVARLVVRGSLDPLLKLLARYEVVDLTSREPGLEETFLALYGEDDDA